VDYDKCNIGLQRALQPVALNGQGTGAAGRR